MSVFEAHSSRIKRGVITHGSLSKGITMRLDAAEPVESLKAGKFMVIEGEQYDFFAMVTDVSLEASNPNILLNPPESEDTFLREVMRGHSTYATIVLKPLLMMPNRYHADLGAEARRVKTIPAHFSPVAEADAEDIARIFGNEANLDEQGNQRFFHVGDPLDMESIPVCVDMNRFVERSNAVFGKTGTGKTFLTRLLLAGTIKTGRAVNLIFDMHSEYGLNARQENGPFVKGLRELFPSKVAIFTMDPDSTRLRSGGASADHDVFIYADQVEPEDILPLRETLSLNQTAAESSFLLRQKFGAFWLRRLLDADGKEAIAELVEETGANENSISALRRKLTQLTRFDFFKTESVRDKKDVVQALLEHILSGKSVVLEFGQYDSLLAYLFVANVITRRLRNEYEKRTNKYLSTRNPVDQPPQLMITIEEAHKFLKPGIASETPFGTIAREMRKYFVSLLVVDQRPSAIDEEILSQIGTKMVAQLNDEKDIAAALVGTGDAAGLRQVLASLDSKQQALIMGHAVPMPVVVRSRSYDETFFSAMQPPRSNRYVSIEDEMQDLF